MSLKRSRHEMMASKNKLSKTPTGDDVKKTVRFQEEPTAIPTTTDDVESSCVQVDVANSKECFWYSRRDMVAQIESFSIPIASAMADGFGILLRDSYEHPHVNVQEYLNAFATYTTTTSTSTDSEDDDECCWRGLEQRLDASHREERSRARSSHVAQVLAAAMTNDWDQLSQLSRQSSAASKLFAMRLGRADARAARNDSVSDDTHKNDAARDIVLDHQRREQYRRERQDSVKRFPGLSLAAPQQHTPKIKA